MRLNVYRSWEEAEQAKKKHLATLSYQALVKYLTKGVILFQNPRKYPLVTEFTKYSGTLLFKTPYKYPIV